MTGGPYSSQQRLRSLQAFGRIALVAGPLIVLVGVLLWTGIWSGGSGSDDDVPLEPSGIAAAGEPAPMEAEHDPQELWGVPADLDHAAVTCRTDEGTTLPLDNPDAGGGTVRADESGQSWVRLALVENEYGEVTCTGGGLTEVGLTNVGRPVDGTRGGVFFVVGGLVTIGAGFLARRITRRS